MEDECVRNTWKKHQQFMNTNLSWKNKWKLDSQGNVQPTIKHWYYFGIYPEHIERFFLSSTVLVFVTDGEHLFQMFKNTAIVVGFLIIDWKYAVAWLVGVFIISFIKEAFLKWLH